MYEMGISLLLSLVMMCSSGRECIAGGNYIMGTFGTLY